MNIQFHWNNLTQYINFIINSKKIMKLCLLQNYKTMADVINNSLLPSSTENNVKTAMGHTEFLIVHIWSLNIEESILSIHKRNDELIGEYRDRVRPHLIALYKLNHTLIENIKIYNTNVEQIKKDKVKPEFDDLVLINF